MKKPILILTRQTASEAAGNIALSGAIADAGYELEYLTVPAVHKPATFLKTLFAPFRFSKYSAVLVFGYAWIAALSVRRAVSFSRTPIGVIGLNQSSSLLKTGFRPADVLLDRALQTIDVGIVHSLREREIWTEVHGIAPERLPFAHWGFDVPTIQSRRFSERADRPYFCMIGRNNRDHQTFCDAIAKSGQRGIIICSGNDVGRFQKHDCVEVFHDLSMDECMDCIRGALANVILVQDASRGAGHITAVAGMHLEKASIFTGGTSLPEYLEDGQTGLAVPIGDTEATVHALKRLAEDPVLAARLGAQGRAYSSQWLTAEAAAKHQVFLVAQAIKGDPLPPIPPEWAASRRT